jgi:hypothetical protein
MADSTLELVAGLTARHVLTGIAGSLVTVGAIHPGADESSFVTIGSGIAVWAVGAGWSWWQKTGQQQVAAALKRVTNRSTTVAAVNVAQAVPVGAALATPAPVQATKS